MQLGTVSWSVYYQESNSRDTWKRYNFPENGKQMYWNNEEYFIFLDNSSILCIYTLCYWFENDAIG